MAIEKIIDNNPEDNNKNKESTKNDVEETASNTLKLLYSIFLEGDFGNCN